MGECTVLASAAGKMPRRRAQTGERTRGFFRLSFASLRRKIFLGATHRDSRAQGSGLVLASLEVNRLFYNPEIKLSGAISLR